MVTVFGEAVSQGLSRPPRGCCPPVSPPHEADERRVSVPAAAYLGESGLVSLSDSGARLLPGSGRIAWCGAAGEASPAVLFVVLAADVPGRHSDRRPSRMQGDGGVGHRARFRCIPGIAVITDTSGSTYAQQSMLWSGSLRASCRQCMSRMASELHAVLPIDPRFSIRRVYQTPAARPSPKSLAPTAIAESWASSLRVASFRRCRQGCVPEVPGPR